jgi:hypothetical protein
MSYFIRIENHSIELPTDKTYDERVEICLKLIDEYPDYFTQSLGSSDARKNIASERVKVRFDIMASYLLAASDNSDGHAVISKYKDKVIKENESLFSELENRYNF